MSQDTIPWSREEFEARLRAKEKYYHIHHPYHVLMASGELNREQIQGWVANRFYYQITIPRKDSAIMANCPDRETRRKWMQRVMDHDGYGDDPGGIEAWIQLGIACGLSREDITSLRHVLPGVRFAVDAYSTSLAPRPGRKPPALRSPSCLRRPSTSNAWLAGRICIRGSQPMAWPISASG